MQYKLRPNWNFSCVSNNYTHLYPILLSCIKLYKMLFILLIINKIILLVLLFASLSSIYSPLELQFWANIAHICITEAL